MGRQGHSKADEGPWPGGSLLLGAPGDVVRPGGCVVLVDELLHDLPGRVHLVEVVLEDVLLAELLHEGLPLPQLVELAAGPLEKGGDAGVVGHHEPADPVG